MLDAKSLWTLAKRSAQGWKDDAAPSMGAALAFYTLLSLAPLLLVILGVAGIVYGRDEAQLLLVQQIAGLLGESAAAGIEVILENAGAPADGILPALLGMATVIFGATTVFGELQSDLNRIWRAGPQKSGGLVELLRTRLLSFGMVVTVGFLLLVSLVASAALSALGEYWFARSQALVRLLEFAVSFLAIAGLFAMVYKVLPRTKVAWGDVWVGAVVTSALFWIGKYLIGLYLGRSSIGSAFGAAGTVVVVIVWVYYSAQIFFLGAEFTREYAVLHGSRQHLRRRRVAPGDAANDDWGHPPATAKSK
jgi:membrane protein